MGLAILAALLIGLCLGLLGSGGSILTVPVLVFILERPEKSAIAEGLAIVGIVASVGSLPYFWRQEISWKSVLFFGVPGMVGAFVGAWTSSFISGRIQLALFACTMLVASCCILFGPASVENGTSDRSSWATLMKGFLVGCLTGLVGVGGGFLIVPALILLCGLPIRLAVGTSLVIIGMNCLTGFIEQCVANHDLILQINWQIIFLMSALAIVGAIFGSYTSKLLEPMKLRKIFGCVLLIMGLVILLNHQ